MKEPRLKLAFNLLLQLLRIEFPLYSQALDFELDGRDGAATFRVLAFGHNKVVTKVLSSVIGPLHIASEPIRAFAFEDVSLRGIKHVHRCTGAKIRRCRAQCQMDFKRLW